MDEAYWAPPSIIEPDPQRGAAVQLQFSAQWQRLITDPGVKKKKCFSHATAVCMRSCVMNEKMTFADVYWDLTKTKTLAAISSPPALSRSARSCFALTESEQK